MASRRMMDCGALLLLPIFHHLTSTSAQLQSGRFFVDVANLWERREANVLTPIPLKLFGQYEIAPSCVLPLGPCLRVACSVRFHAEHSGHSSAFSCRSHDFLNQHPSFLGNLATRQLVPSQAIAAHLNTVVSYLDRKRVALAVRQHIGTLSEPNALGCAWGAALSRSMQRI